MLGELRREDGRLRARGGAAFEDCARAAVGMPASEMVGTRLLTVLERDVRRLQRRVLVEKVRRHVWSHTARGYAHEGRRLEGDAVAGERADAPAVGLCASILCFEIEG